MRLILRCSAATTLTTTGGVRLTRTARLKMSEFYHDSLVGRASLRYFTLMFFENIVKENMNQLGLPLFPQWKSVGEAVSVTLMWGDVPGFVYLPYALQHPRLTLGLSNLLQDNLYAKFGGKSGAKAMRIVGS